MQCQAKRHNRYKSKAWSKAERSHNHFFLYPAVTHTVGSVQSPVLATTTATVELFNWPLAREQEGRDPLLCFLQTSDHKQWQLARSERNHTARVADAPGKFTCSPEKVNKRWTGLANPVLGHHLHLHAGAPPGPQWPAAAAHRLHCLACGPTWHAHMAMAAKPTGTLIIQPGSNSNKHISFLQPTARVIYVYVLSVHVSSCFKLTDGWRHQGKAPCLMPWLSSSFTSSHYMSPRYEGCSRDSPLSLSLYVSLSLQLFFCLCGAQNAPILRRRQGSSAWLIHSPN